MPTLEDILNNDLGLGSEQPSNEKTASQNPSEQNVDSEIEKLAMEVGLGGNTETPSVPQEEPLTGQSKEASMSLDNIYNGLFPEDAGVVGNQEKVASEQPAGGQETGTDGLSKEAADREERIGERAYDYFEQYVDGHITKMAEELTGDATISAKNTDDSQAPQTMANNEPKNSDDPMNTTPVVEDQVTAQKGSQVVGTEDQKQPAANVDHSELKEAAVRKHLILAELGQAPAQA